MRCVAFSAIHSKGGATSKWVQLLTVLASLACAHSVSAQSRTTKAPQKSVIQQQLETMGSAVRLVDGRGQGSREILLRWSQVTGTQPQSAVRQRLQMVRQVKRSDAVPRQRSLEIVPGQLLITVSDRQGVICHTVIMSDPRITVAEYADAGGKINRIPDIVNPEVPLEVVVPESVEVSEIRVYQAALSADHKLLLNPLVSSVVSGVTQ